MGLWQRSTLPNALTVLRVLLAPAIFFLVFLPGFGARALAFVLFLIAAFSDVWDGHLARKHGWITDFGKLVDPLADKLLLVATFIPFYILSRRDASGVPRPLRGVVRRRRAFGLFPRALPYRRAGVARSGA